MSKGIGEELCAEGSAAFVGGEEPALIMTRTMRRRNRKPEKPLALKKGSRIGLVAVSSPAERGDMLAGIQELERLGFAVEEPIMEQAQGYFAGTTEERTQNLCKTFLKKTVDGVVAIRGGYGATYVAHESMLKRLKEPKCVIGFSDFTVIQTILTGQRNWVTFYGPMVAAGLNHGVGQPHGYDEESFREAVGRTRGKWKLELSGESLLEGSATGRLHGGCLTLLQNTLGTPWEIETEGTILVLEDTHMKPYQVDRALMQLKQAGKLRGVNGVLLGDFPHCAPTVNGGATVREICERILGPLGVPVVYGAPIGHTARPMLTIPLGVRGKLIAKGEGTLEILEPAVE